MKKSSKITIVFSIIAVIIIIIIVSLASRKKVSNTNITTNSSEDPEKLNSESSGCRHWSLAGDQICHDEANTEECQYDRGDCCDVQNDFSLCSECFCYSTKNDNDTVIENCPSQSKINWGVLGDGKCQIQLNNILNLFDAGDCCLDFPECQLIINGTAQWGAIALKTMDIACPENLCIKSDFCIKEFKGDGICDDFNNSHHCEFDLQDCCGSNRDLDGALYTCCHCACIPVT